LLQRPSLPATAHDWQVPSHAVVQQIPCSQRLEAHSLGDPQGAPGGFGPQLPLTQARPGAQSASVAQLPRHLPSAPQAYAPQEALLVAWQAPPPSQTAANVSVPPVQDSGVQTVLAGYLRQAPAPSQVPSCPHDGAPSSAQPPRGSVPGAAGTHTPACSGVAHDMQAPAHAVSQHRPSAQKPLSQSAGAAQGAPFGIPPGSASPSTPPLTLEIDRSAPASRTLSASAPPHPASASTSGRSDSDERMER
jgi:hypothetical protein